MKDIQNVEKVYRSHKLLNIHEANKTVLWTKANDSTNGNFKKEGLHQDPLKYYFNK